ncbi:2-octaprenyl-6-methoxyphenyl hydroxylase [Alteromonas gilva]|uniref:2-octaprenyl-6-methoxyphenyl hydroxylase n=1 Tax=Alteromonas gilva TaxID=2987522 RepID=A0ABT5KZK2_9ALTE|nr:2-octaprenyl-6-methoxyphenyl hydroxylase [Alteromonas gilva]MDC8830208.1 2-octaprenyl-6-methoxyphenyl hydroxylase [Alteromonas gilva]
MKHSDIVIVGGGAVGATLARSLVNEGRHSVTLIDANRFSHESTTHPGFDARVIALAKRSEQALRALGINLSKAHATPIEHILVSDQGFAGQTRLHASDYQLDSFGQVVSIQALGQQLFPAQLPGLTLLEGITVEQAEQQPQQVHLKLSDGGELSAKLVVVADGGRSALTGQLGFTRSHKDYGQSAVIANLRMSELHQGWAHERFTANGPLALLPFADDTTPEHGGCCYSLVWTLSHDEAQAALTWSQAEFITRLQQHIGYRHGVIRQVSNRYCYPLTLQQTQAFTTHRAVVVGNSAQTLHPIAGQGFNLGLRDVLDLVEVLGTAEDAGAFSALNAYQAARQRDKNLTIGLTDALVTVFSNRLTPLVAGRNLGLLAMEFCKPLSQRFVQQTMGYGNAAAPLISK